MRFLYESRDCFHFEKPYILFLFFISSFSSNPQRSEVLGAMENNQALYAFVGRDVLLYGGHIFFLSNSTDYHHEIFGVSMIKSFAIFFP